MTVPTLTLTDIQSMRRHSLIAWLSANDRNGCYSDLDCWSEFDDILTTQYLRDIVWCSQAEHPTGDLDDVSEFTADAIDARQDYAASAIMTLRQLVAAYLDVTIDDTTLFARIASQSGVFWPVPGPAGRATGLVSRVVIDCAEDDIFTSDAEHAAMHADAHDLGYTLTVDGGRFTFRAVPTF
jgi:hypothetical protein